MTKKIIGIWILYIIYDSHNKNISIRLNLMDETNLSQCNKSDLKKYINGTEYIFLKKKK